MSDQSSPIPHTVFVSHAHADNDLCDRYVAALRARGLDVWYDRTNMQVGHSLTGDIEAELRKRTAFVLLATPASLASEWVRAEVAAFRYLANQDPARLFLPVRAVECEMLLMRDIRWIDAVSIGFDATVHALAVALRAPTPPAPSVAQPMNVAVQPLLSATEPADSKPPMSTMSAIAAVAGIFLPGNWKLRAYDVATRLDPSAVHGWLLKATELFEQGKHEEALADIDQALTLDKSNATLWGLKGEILYDQGKYIEALACYDQALTFEAAKKVALRLWFEKGETLSKLGRHAEALAAYNEALTFAPDDADIWGSKALALRELGRGAEAEQAERKARELGWKGDE